MYEELPQKLIELSFNEPVFKATIDAHKKHGTKYEQMLEAAVMNLAVSKAFTQEQLLKYINNSVSIK